MNKKETKKKLSELPLDGERFIPVFEGDIVPEHYHRYFFASKLTKGKRVLDIACGEGYGSDILSRFASHVIGVDVDATAVMHARKIYQKHNVEFLEGDCTKIPVETSSVDVVVSFETIEHHDNHVEMILEIKRVLRPNGLLIMSSPEKINYNSHIGIKNPFHVKELTGQEFEILLNSNFLNKAMLGQRMLYASAIVDPRASGKLFIQDHGCEKENSELIRPIYLIALASDSALPDSVSSLYTTDLAQSDVYRDRERAFDIELSKLKANYDSCLVEAERKYESLNILNAQERSAHNAQVETLSEGLENRVREYSEYVHQSKKMSWLASEIWTAIRELRVSRRRHVLERRRVAQSGYFDAEWYIKQNPDVHASGEDPLSHFLTNGAFEGRDPSGRFNSIKWVINNPWLVKYHRNPLLNFLDYEDEKNGRNFKTVGDPAKIYADLWSSAVTQSENFVPLSDNFINEPLRIRAIAFYLPQFHPFQENNTWWGRGFTEWTNVSKALPQFEGHYQPHLPGELGFYDLRLPEVQERQVELAKQYGLSAFCFHYYWFSGRKRLLERPLEQYINNKNIDFPFCVCWANENWTRRWDGQENDILMEQRHTPEDDIQFIRDIVPLLLDRRYVRVDGKPLLIVYRVSLLPDPVSTAKVWRQYCLANGVGEIHLVVAQSFGITDPREYGFDAAVEFPPHGLMAPTMSDRVAKVNANFAGVVFDYSDVVATEIQKSQPDYVLYPTVFPSWDNEARKPGRGHVFAHSTPELYRKWLTAACERADEKLPKENKLVFINAWNEWAEGAHLEPDRKFGYAWLEATQRVLTHYPNSEAHPTDEANRRLALSVKKNNTAVILHLFYPDLWDEIYIALRNLEGRYDLYLTIPENVDESHYTHVLDDVPDATLLPFPNRGRDVGPFLVVAKTLLSMNYAQVCKLHTKRSLHRGDGDKWRDEFLKSLLGNGPAHIIAIEDAFRKNVKLGLIGPTGHCLEYLRYWGYPESRPDHFRKLARKLGLGNDSLESLIFFAGSMFWFRPQAIERMLLNIRFGDFEVELGQKDGTLAHELERLFAGVVKSSGYLVSSTEDLAKTPSPVIDYRYAKPSPSFAHYQSLEVPLAGESKLTFGKILRARANQIPLAVKIWKFFNK